MRGLFSTATVAAALISVVTAVAQDGGRFRPPLFSSPPPPLPAPVIDLKTADDFIDLQINFEKLVKAPVDIGTVSTGNSAIADVNPLNPRTAVLTGKSEGTTSLLVLDMDGNPIYSAVVRVGVYRPNSVKIHATLNPHGYLAYYCTPTGCARAKDVDSVPPPPPAQRPL